MGDLTEEVLVELPREGREEVTRVQEGEALMWEG